MNRLDIGFMQSRQPFFGVFAGILTTLEPEKVFMTADPLDFLCTPKIDRAALRIAYPCGTALGANCTVRYASVVARCS